MTQPIEQIRLLQEDFEVTQDMTTLDWIVRIKDDAVRRLHLDGNTRVTDLIAEVVHPYPMRADKESKD